jgi:hypothetical protein
MNDLSHPVEKA